MANDFAALRAAGFRGTGARAVEADYTAAAALLGAGARELRAVISVESSGSGFYADGRLKMLFEPHRFYAKLKGAKRDQAVKAGLAYPKWGTKPYPKDSYPRLVQALVIDEAAALASCSWGLTQIMGENAEACGFDSPQAMVAAFAAGEAAQLRATCALMAAKGLGPALRAHNWPAVAKGWNGAQYSKNAYDKKLALAYAKASPSKVVSKVIGSTKAATAPLPSVAPLTFGQLVQGFFAQLLPQHAAA